MGDLGGRHMSSFAIVNCLGINGSLQNGYECVPVYGIRLPAMNSMSPATSRDGGVQEGERKARSVKRLSVRSM